MAEFRIDLPCPTCHGDGFAADGGDRHTETRTHVCPTCKNRGTVPAHPGMRREASADPATGLPFGQAAPNDPLASSH